MTISFGLLLKVEKANGHVKDSSKMLDLSPLERLFFLRLKAKDTAISRSLLKEHMMFTSRHTQMANIPSILVTLLSLDLN